MTPQVLIIDDSLTVRMDLDEAFESAGFEPTLCSTLSEARTALSAGAFAVIVLDVLLPDGDGIEFLEEIKNNPVAADVPVMLLSTESEVRDRIRGLRMGADDYVGKPYERSYIIGRARELARPQPEPAESTSILIIDDSPTFREEMKAALEASGYSVTTAATGEEGLQTAINELPAAIVVDGTLPGIDGAAVIRNIRADAALRRTLCILLTASEEKTAEVLALDAGADHFIRKGEDPAVILARLGAALRTVGAPPAVRPPSSLLRPKKILAIDDSITYLHEVAEQLRHEGYDVMPAHSGEEALELLRVQAVSVDCILLDMVMPGLSGEQTCRLIKGSDSWRHIPLIMHTSLDDKESMITGIDSGADDYVAKSSDPEVLRARVRAQLRRKQFEDENRTIREELLRKEIEVSTANSARELAETRATFAAELELKNQELQSFSYSVSHDLRNPVNIIKGFSELLMDRYAGALDDKGKDYLQTIHDAVLRMVDIIEGLILLSRLSRAEVNRDVVDLSVMAGDIIKNLEYGDPNRKVARSIKEHVRAGADSLLIRRVLDNLLSNAWKFTAKVAEPRIEFGSTTNEEGEIFYVRDNGAGFDPAHAERLFRPFQRLHRESDFPGTGIGLATVQRVIERHGGRIWAESAPNEGATFYFTLPGAAPEA
ncbi:MAG TPA: response regulator [Blastocatellia bacterium]